MKGKRPAVVTFFGVLNLFFGACGLLAILIYIFFGKKVQPLPLSQKIALPVSTIFLLVTGYGLLAMKEWVRKIFVYGNVLALVFVVFSLVFLLIKMSSYRLSDLVGYGVSVAVSVFVIYYFSKGDIKDLFD